MLRASGDRFTTFGPEHLVVLAVLVVGCFLAVWWGRRLRASGDETRTRRALRALAVAIPVCTVPLQVLQFLPGEWNLNTSLPLQVCDWGWVLAVYALWTRRSWAVATTWLWGTTLTLQGVLTPDLASTVTEPRFWMFWGMHLLIVWAAVLLVWGLRIVPSWRDLAAAVALTVGWAATAMVFNAVAGTNYGYLNGKPSSSSLLDVLGPWPGYVLVEVLVVVAVWTLMVAAWQLAERVARRKAERQALRDLGAVHPTSFG